MVTMEAKPRVALLGATDAEIELLAEFQRGDQVDLVALYDPNPHAPGLALAEIAGIPAGSDAAARERLATADVIVLPGNRSAYQTAIDWCSGLRAELIGNVEARRRWGSAPVALAATRGTPSDLEARLAELETAAARLGSLEILGEHLLDAAMRAVGASGGSLQLLAPDTAELYLLAARGLSEQVIRHARHPLGQPIAGLVAAMRAPQIVHGEHPGRAASQRGPLSSALSLPLATVGGNLMGVLNVSSTVPGRRFGPHDLERLQDAAPRLAALLEQARLHPAGSRSAESRLLQRLSELEAQGTDLAGALTLVGRELCRVFDADSARFHLCTEDGDWFQPAAVTRSGQGSVPAASRALAERALLQRTLLHVPLLQTPRENGTGDEVHEVVERALAPTDESEAPPVHSWVYAPLAGSRNVGVLSLQFPRLATAEAFVQWGGAALHQVARFVEGRVRERQLLSRLASRARLNQLLPMLTAAQRQGNLDATLVREAARLVGAQRAILRRVDEERRTYSRPTLYGIADAETEAWRTFDTRITEGTLQSRHLDLRTTQHGQSDRLDAVPRSHSLLSLPILQGERIVAVLNLYDKTPEDPLQGQPFTEFESELLRDLAGIAAELFLAALSPRHSALETTPIELAPAPEEAERSPQPESRRLREELRRELARAQRHQRQLVLSLIHVKGWSDLDDPLRQRLRKEIGSMLQDYVRASDLVGWYGPDRLLVLSPEANSSGNELETRLRRLLHERGDEAHSLEITLGSSSYPADGEDAASLLHAAASRLG